MKKGAMIRININRNKYGLPQANEAHSSILLARVIETHREKISIQAFDIFGSKTMKYLTIEREEVLSKI